MITYKDIYEAAKKERYSENLQPIDKDFIKYVANYIHEKREAAYKADDVFSDTMAKTKKQLENATTLFQELLRRRRKKILSLTLIASETGISKQDFDNMLFIEKELFESLMKCIDESDQKLNEALSNRSMNNGPKNEMVVFLEDVEAFVSTDGESMGPFEVGEIINIPIEIARNLISEKKVESIDN